MDSKDAFRTIWSRDGCNLYLLWQLELHKVVWESSVSWQVQPHRDQVPVYPWYGGEGSFESSIHCHRWVGRGCVDQVVVQGEVWVLQRQAWSGPSQEWVMIDRLDSRDSEHNRVGQ